MSKKDIYFLSLISIWSWCHFIGILSFKSRYNTENIGLYVNIFMMVVMAILALVNHFTDFFAGKK